MTNTAPDITFRDATDPTSVLSSVTLAQSSLGTDNLPIMQGEDSYPVKFRIYNNYAANSNIAEAFNFTITAYDGSGAASRTATKSAVNQSWIRIYETGFGENSTPPGLYTAWNGSDTAIGGNPAGTNAYYPEVDSSGAFSDQIRAGSSNAGVGFIEFEIYAQLPDSVAKYDWNIAIGVSYEWVY